LSSTSKSEIDLAAVDEAVRELEALDPRQAQIVELRFFGGLTIEEIAATLHISPTTVKREWTVAKLWLRQNLSAAGLRLHFSLAAPEVILCFEKHR
jgi:RNA polymerase sigma factor (sigma-70 family)